MTTDTIDAPAADAAASPAPVTAQPKTRTLDVPLTLITPHPLNPRRHHADAAIERRRWNLEELAESIREHGVMQPVLLRPRPGAQEGDGSPLYELVAGERRWLASRLAEQPTIPAVCRELTDIQALELQVIENGQREDLHPLEEALGFRHLLDTPGGYDTPEEIAARVGKTVRWVYSRLKLLTLSEKAQRAFFAGEISASVAQELAEGVPDAAEQDKHLPTILAGWGGDPFTARGARKWLRENAMLQLDRAKFDVAGSIEVATFPSCESYCVPETLTVRTVTVGPCAQCPKHTAANPDFFEDVKEGDRCQDVACYRAKTAAAHELLLQAARDEGSNVITGPAAKKAMPQPNIPPRDQHIWTRPCPALTERTEPLCELIDLAPQMLTLIDHPDTGAGVITLAGDMYVREALAKRGLLRKPPEDAPAAKKVKPKKAKDGGGGLVPNADDGKPDPLDERFGKLLEAPVIPKEFGGEPTPAALKTYVRDAEKRVHALTVGRAIAKHLRDSDEFGMPDSHLPQALLVLISAFETIIGVADIARLLDIEPPAKTELAALEAWALTLSDEEATRMVMLTVALTDAGKSPSLGRLPELAALSLGLQPRPLLDEARKAVAESVKLELVARAAPAKAKKAAAEKKADAA